MTQLGLPKDSRVFITGGGGFLGRTLAGRCGDVERLTIYDTSTKLTPADFSHQPQVNLVRGDVLDFHALSQFMPGHDFVFHCAARLGVKTVATQPIETLDTNIRGSSNVLAVASSLPDIARVVCFSTSEIYGIHAAGAVETDAASVPPPGDPRWAYAASKLAEEHYSFAYHHQRGLPVTVVRPFNVYGPGQAGEGAIANFVRASLRNSVLEVRNGGTQIRAWCFVNDFIDGVILAATRSEGNGQTFNIGNPKEVESTLGLAERIVSLSRSRSRIEHVTGGAEIEERVPDITKATDLLGFEPRIDLAAGLTATIAWFRGELS